jgi:ATP-binding cassette, subfamily B, multidrug efflux pump
VFTWFERLVDPYPAAAPAPPPAGFLRFLWACSEGTRPYIALMTLLTAGIGAFEALLFSMMAHVVDWLANVPPAGCWARDGGTLALLSAVLVGSIALAALQALFKYQALFGNFPMRLRWNFHRLMLGQSMGFYQDEFAGRIATKVMQTALAVRDTWLIVADILVYVVIYFVTMVAVVGGFDAWLLGPFLGWLVLLWMRWYFVPRLGKVAQAGRRALADDRPHHRRLHQHRHRQAVLARPARGHFARAAMQEFLARCYRQMRLVTAFEIVNQVLSVVLIAAIAGRRAVAVDTRRGRRRRGGGGHARWPAAERHLALGDVGDGHAVRAHRHGAGRHGHAVARAACRPARARRRSWSARRGALRECGFAYGGVRAVIDGLDL